jgi:hypothetical protein
MAVGAIVGRSVGVKAVGVGAIGAAGEQPATIKIKLQAALRNFLIPIAPLCLVIPTLIAYLFSFSPPLENYLYGADYDFFPIRNNHASTVYTGTSFIFDLIRDSVQQSRLLACSGYKPRQ